MLNRRGFLGYSAALGALGVSHSWAQEAGAIPPEYPASYAEIIKGSRSEGGLTVYTSIATAQWQPMINGFNKAYPWVKVEPLELDAGEVVQRYLAEVGTHTRTADLLVTAATDAWLDLMSRDQILPYESPEAAPYPAWSKPKSGLYTINVDPTYFLWNKALLPEKLRPTSFADLVEKAAANPDVFRGKISAYGAHQTSMGYNLHYDFAKHHGEKVWDWYRTLGPLTRFEQGAGPMLEKVTSGEYLVLYFSAARTTRMAISDPIKGKILGASYISDGTPLLLMGTAVPKASTNVNSAKLLLDFVLSIPGQKLMPATGRTVFNPKLTSADVGGAATYVSILDEIGEANAWPADYDPAMVKDYAAFMKRWKEANGV
ncbi:MAG: Iron(III) transport system substrate-binding protein [Massilia sp.]|nr:Iron(III) transport system substrate-binding protein [Massilia sp.]